MAEPTLKVARKNRFRLSLVWLVPLVAAVVAMLLVYRSFAGAGPQITIEFGTAEGIEANKTEIRYKEVVVGHVTGVELGRSRDKVVVTARLDKIEGELAVEDTQFWVVRPRIGVGGVSGLSTLVSGAYIGMDLGTSQEPRREFTGLEVPPYVLRGEPGRSFVLRSPSLGSLDVGSPIYYRRVRVGRVVGYTFDGDRDELLIRVFIEAPNEHLVNADTRFWNASGIDLSLNANGLTLNTQSIASVVAGGIAFASSRGLNASENLQAAAEGAQFRLFGNQQDALSPPDGPPLSMRMVFDQSIRGLTVGSPVDLLGIEIGNVRSISVRYDTRTHRFPAEVIATIYPARIGQSIPQQGTATPAVRNELLKTLVDNGVRAQLRNGNLLTGQVYVALDFVPDAKRATIDVASQTPTIPSVPGAFDDLQQQLAQIVARINKVPFDTIGTNLSQTLASANVTINKLGATIDQMSPEMQQTMKSLQATLGGLQQTMTTVQRSLGEIDRNFTTEDAPLQRNANQALGELQRAAQSMRSLADYLQQHPETLIRGKPADPKPAPSTNPSATPAGANR
ncbi:MlaD family protein [soil metagenome]